MKKNYFCSLLLGILATFTSHSQTFSGYGSTPSNDNYNYINYSSDTMYYTFSSLPAGAYGTATLTIDGSAYFNPGSSYNIYGPGATLIGSFTHTLYNCAIFSTSITIPSTDINAYGGSVVFKLVKQGTVYPYCSDSRLRVQLQYGYCSTGIPVQQANFSFGSDSLFCQSEGNIPLTGFPAGGVFSGNGITNGVIDLSVLSPGTHELTYTLTEANGCYTQNSTSFMVRENPADRVIQACQNIGPEIHTDAISYVYASNNDLSDILGSGTDVILPPLTNSPTVIYSAVESNQFTYTINSFDTTNFQLIDHESLSDDDRGGIAVNANYVYIVGDEATARYDLNLQNGIDLPKRDGIFTDLAQLKLYTFYNTVSPNTPNDDDFEGFTMNALRSLNDDLTLGSEIILLSQPVTVGVLDQGVVLAGYNEVIVGTANGTYDFYHISILNGLVTSLGQHNLEVYGSENWADWGMSGFDGTDHHAYFRDANDSITDYNFTTNTSSVIFTITDFSDMSSFIAHPINNRFYGHYEGSTPTFGGDEETLFYFQLSDTASRLAATPENYGCPGEVTFTFNTIDLGADTTVCSEDGLYIIPGGFGYSSYTWNGVNNNFNSYVVQNTGEVVLSVTDNINCTLTDSIFITVTDCTAGITELGQSSLEIYPVPNNGTFLVTFEALTEEAQLVIIDAQGKQITNKAVAKGETTVGMDVKVQPGIYFIRLVSETGTTQRAISIQ